MTLALFVVMGMTFLFTPASSPGTERSAPVLVRYIVDGDTIDVVGVGRVRLLGIDAPEVGAGFDTAAPFAIESKNRLSALVANRWVRLEYEGSPRDGYNRRLAYVLLENGVCVNVVLVREGLARVSARIALSRLGELKAAEADARSSRRGMWGRAPSLPAERYVVPRVRPPKRKSGPSPDWSSRRASAAATLMAWSFAPPRVMMPTRW